VPRQKCGGPVSDASLDPEIWRIDYVSLVIEWVTCASEASIRRKVVNWPD